MKIFAPDCDEERNFKLEDIVVRECVKRGSDKKNERIWKIRRKPSGVENINLIIIVIYRGVELILKEP